MKWFDRVPSWLSVGAWLWCFGVGIRFWLTPLAYTSHGSDSVGAVQIPFSQASKFGPLPLLIPVGLVTLALWSANTGRLGVLVGITLMFGAFSLVAGFSIGAAYLPAAGALLFASIVGAYADLRRVLDRE